MKHTEGYVPYSAPRWNEPIKAEVVGKVERTEQEHEEIKKKISWIFKKRRNIERLE